MSSTISAPGVANTADRDRSGAWAAFQAKLGELLDTYRRAGRDLESQARREALRHELADLRARLAAGVWRSRRCAPTSARRLRSIAGASAAPR